MNSDINHVERSIETSIPGAGRFSVLMKRVDANILEFVNFLSECDVFYKYLT